MTDKYLIYRGINKMVVEDIGRGPGFFITPEELEGKRIVQVYYTDQDNDFIIEVE